MFLDLVPITRSVILLVGCCGSSLRIYIPFVIINFIVDSCSYQKNAGTIMTFKLQCGESNTKIFVTNLFFSAISN